MTIDADTLIKTAQFALTVAGIVYAWVVSQGKAHEPAMKELRDGLADATKRLNKVEGDLLHVPNKEALHRIDMAIQKVEGDIKAATDKWDTVQRSIARLEEYLLRVEAQQDGPPRQAAARRGRK